MESAIDLGLSPVPDDASNEVQAFATSRTQWLEEIVGRFLEVLPDMDEMSRLECPPPPFGVDIAMAEERGRFRLRSVNSDRETNCIGRRYPFQRLNCLSTDSVHLESRLSYIG